MAAEQASILRYGDELEALELFEGFMHARRDPVLHHRRRWLANNPRREFGGQRQKPRPAAGEHGMHVVRLARADDVIDNAGPRSAIDAQVAALDARYRVLAEAKRSRDRGELGQNNE